MRHCKQALELARDLSERSDIKIKVGAVIFDKDGIVSWGWNNPGRGYGEHAEAMAIRRLNLRLVDDWSSLRIAVYSTRKGRPITSKPCTNCQKLLEGVGILRAVYYRKYEINGKFQVSLEEVRY